MGARSGALHAWLSSYAIHKALLSLPLGRGNPSAVAALCEVAYDGGREAKAGTCMNAVEIIALILFALGGIIGAFHDSRIGFALIALAGVLVCLELGDVIH